MSENSVDVLLRKARLEMIRVRDEESKGKEHSRVLASEGKLDEAIRHMQLHLELDPDDADSWYELGNLLCKAGRASEGYKAFNRGRKAFKRSLVASTTAGTVAPHGTRTVFPSISCPFFTLQHFTMVFTSGSVKSAGQTLMKGTSE